MRQFEFFERVTCGDMDGVSDAGITVCVGLDMAAVESVPLPLVPVGTIVTPEFPGAPVLVPGKLQASIENITTAIPNKNSFFTFMADSSSNGQEELIVG
jgi:hypothetical protein